MPLPASPARTPQDHNLPSIEKWAEQVRAGEIRAISRAITAIENHAPQAEPLLKILFPLTGAAYLAGITGAPGTGKSTLVDRIAAYHRKQNETVGVIAVDPTSPYTGGAILGDRVRMQSHAGDAGIFIRSMATRGFLGGLSRATAEVALLLDAAGKRQILIETVGVGQDEIDIVRLADCVVVVLVPGLGDDIQNMKAGLMEIADIFVLNKSDREGADRLEEQIQAMLSLVMPRDGWHPPVMSWLLGLFDAILPGTALFVVFDALLFFGSLFALAWLNPIRNWAAAGIAALIVANPLVVLYEGIVWKDVLFADATIAGFAALAFAAARWRNACLRFTLIGASVVLLSG